MAETDKKDLPKYLRCNDCGWSGSTFRMGCPNCGASHLVELESSGIGKIVDLVPVFYPPENLKDFGPYVSVLVEFDEGFQMLGISSVKPEDLSIGSSVVVSSFDKDTMRLMIKRG